jgi:putative DNA primase/helicase
MIEWDEQPYVLKNGMTLINPEDIQIFKKLLSQRPHCSVDYLWNDIGLGNLFAECFSGTHRFCVDNQKWYIYDRGIWTVDKGDIQAQGNMQRLLQLLHLYCSEVDEDPEVIKNYKNYISKSSSDTILRRALNASKNNLVINLTDFDSDPYLLNCNNGVYDMRDQKFRFAKPEDYFTLTVSCNYPTGIGVHKCDRWFSFVDEIMEGDKEKAAFLQRALGYSLLGVNREECMFLAYGRTRSGKGTLFNTIAKVLGMGTDTGYGGSVNSSLVCESKFKDRDYNAPEPMLADTVGLRYITLSETKKGALLDVNAIKSLTGRDPRKTRQLHCPAFTFTPQFTMWLSTNFLPKVNDDSLFKSDRLWVIEFNKHFEEDDRDYSLKEIFEDKDNQAVILKWLLDGYRAYTEEGLNPPDCVREATARYARLNDRILCFKEDCLEDAPGERVSNGLLYSKYKEWCEDEEREYNPLGSTTFYTELERFYKRGRSSTLRFFADVRLKE